MLHQMCRLASLFLGVFIVSHAAPAAEKWEKVYCVQYGEIKDLPLGTFLAGAGAGESINVPLTFCIATRGSEVVVLDSGYVDQKVGDQWGVEGYIGYEKLFSQLGLTLEQVQYVTLGHLHWDHAGGTSRFPNAKFVVQRREIEFAAGRMPHNQMARRGFTATEIIDIVKLNWEDRVLLVDGDAESLLPGLDVFLTPGHTMGTMTVCLDTIKGRVCYASDAVYLYRNIEKDIALGHAIDPDESVESYKKIRRVLDSGIIVPSHEPAIFSRTQDFGFRRVSERIVAIVE